MTIGNLIAKWRTERGLSQTALAASLGVAQTTLASWEAGANDTARETFGRIADLLEIPDRDRLLAWRLPARPPTTTPKATRSPRRTSAVAPA